jgi:hypothetical protein
VAERRFPFRVRADLQRAVDALLGGGVAGTEGETATPSAARGAFVRRFCGVHQPYSHEGLHFSSLLVSQDRHYPPVVTPPHYEEVDVGEESPVRCLRIGLWLLEHADGLRQAVLLCPHESFGRSEGLRLQIASPDTPSAVAAGDALFKAVEAAVHQAPSYRGKILSLEQGESYSGYSSGIKVHKLRTVSRDQVILPRKTIDLLDRNVIDFVRRRAGLRALGQATKKGLLFYGPPGTGKSHTIHYLAAALPGHTTLLITAEQVGLLGEYMTLARLLQPSVVVIEDVDLIARDRRQMGGACEEALLNKLLNEMDGLRESADIVFLLTTNRPESLEAALASRPGRIDQAIEFPLPDEPGREKLVRLYSRGASLSEDVVGAVVARTDGVSAAFIKELMRRAAQFRLERGGGGDGANGGHGDGDSLAGEIELVDVDAALDEMLFTGGSLNLTLLGGPSRSRSGFLQEAEGRPASPP